MNSANFKQPHEHENIHAVTTTTDDSLDKARVEPRQGECSTAARFRANRLFSSGSAWYFSTREGLDQGPFLSKEQALKAITSFIDAVNK